MRSIRIVVPTAPSGDGDSLARELGDRLRVSPHVPVVADNKPDQRPRDGAEFQRNIESMRSLQAAWRSQALHQRWPPDRVLGKPVLPPAECGRRELNLAGAATRRIGADPGAPRAGAQA